MVLGRRRAAEVGRDAGGMPSGRRLLLLSRARLPRRLREQLEGLVPADLLPWDGDGVLARQAAEAEVVPRLLEGRDEALQGQVAEGVRGDEVRDLVDRPLVRDELVPGLHVDPEVTGRPDGRAADAHVDLLGPRAAEHLDDLPDRRSADDGVVDEDDALVLQ